VKIDADRREQRDPDPDPPAFRRQEFCQAYDDLMAGERKQAEVDYPQLLSEAGSEWLRNKPFRHDPRETARLLIDFGYVLQLLELHAGTKLCELGCGSGWMTRFAARHGVEAEGYDISPAMIEIAREQAALEHLEVRFEVADMENVRLGRRFDACLLYDALHHSTSPERVFRSAAHALSPGGRLLLAEPNWKQKFQGQTASRQFGTTELGYTGHALKRALGKAGFIEITRFHNNRKRLFSNNLRDVLAHVAEPLAYRLLALFWTQIWLRATAPQELPR